MKGGFTFCGIDIADIGLEYAPENKDTYVYAPAKSTIHEETFEGHDGGYSYGTSKEPKEFILRCFYEQEHIAKGLMANAHNLFKVGRKGLLVFKRRPWCYYYATVTDVNTDDMYNYLNGLFTVTMKAYYPYARGLEVNGHLFYNLRTDEYHAEIMENTALFDYDNMMPQTTFTSISSETSVILYNPGTERAKVDIVISGRAGDGIKIKNITTGQETRYVAFDTKNLDYVYTDGINGKTVLDSGGDRTLAFLYHDYGYIELEPAFPILREIYANYSGTTVTTQNILFEDESEKDWYKGKYIFLGNNWYKISVCTDKHTLTLETAAESGFCKTSIVKMNEIKIIPTQGTELTKLSFIYKPTYA